MKNTMYDAIIFSDTNGTLGFGRYGGAYKIASTLRSNGYRVKVLEFFADLLLDDKIDDILKTYISNKTIFVGFATTLFGKYVSSEQLIQNWTNSKKPIRKILGTTNLFPHSEERMIDLFDKIKSKNPKCKIIVGGAKAAYGKHPGVDYWVLGQGENSILAIVDYLKNGTALKTIPAIVGKYVTEKDYPYNTFFNSSMIYTADDDIFPNEHVPLEIARGCVFRCSFCAFSLNGKKFGDYTKTETVIRDELIRNYELFGITGYMLTDDTLNDSAKKIEFLHKIFTNLPFKIEFSSYARLDIIHKHRFMREALLEMGAKSLQFGIETFNHDAGKQLGKGLHPDKQKETLSYLREKWENKVLMGGGFIVGLPGETVSSMTDTLDWLSSDECTLDAIQVVPLSVHKFDWERGSNLVENPSKYKIEIDGLYWRTEGMDKNIAEELTDTFYNTKNAKTKANMGAFQFYSRLRNLGFSHDDCITKAFLSDETFVEEAEKARVVLYNKYKELL